MKLARHGNGPEIFASIQGEGISAGKPSTFVRLSLCNLHCTWCDTDYTWNWDDTDYPHVNDCEPGYQKYSREQEIITSSVETVAERVRDLAPHNVIFTGGEPMLQGSALAKLAALLKQYDNRYRFEIETNGTLHPPEVLDRHIAQYNVSPKLSNSGNSPQEREKADTLRHFAQNARAWFKFVVTASSDLEEILQLQRRYAINAERILLMPEGTHAASLDEKADWLKEQCLDHGYLFSDRLHVRLYGNARGV
ncbi:MAG: 7-carboxy-7-deazaguanine synthase QueE [Verrucomicrobiota bacterium]